MWLFRMEMDDGEGDGALFYLFCVHIREREDEMEFFFMKHVPYSMMIILCCSDLISIYANDFFMIYHHGSLWKTSHS